ncbi:hypothetical protein ACT3TH_11000 [Psychrobacter sp. AOP22-C1-C5]|uniref:hypothetical protein n=1 Tax=Psychrobacter sp. AOP22-C1-C5 TaxID=3457716 RepID=UPI004034FEC8
MDRARDIQNLNPNNEVRRTFENFIKVCNTKGSDGVLLEDTHIVCLYHKDSALYSLEWSQVDPKVEIKKKVEDNWIVEDGDAHSRFPVKIFSQKQVYDFAKNPNALLNLIDQSSSVQYKEWNMRWGDEISRYYSLCAQKRELELQISHKPTLVGQLADIEQKISVLENSSHQEVLTKYQNYANKSRIISEYQSSIVNFSNLFTNLIDEQSPKLNLSEFKPVLESEVEIASHLELLSEQLETFKQDMLNNIYTLESQLEAFDKSYSQSNFISEKSAAVAAQTNLSQTFISQGIESSNQYESLIDTKLSLEKSIDSLNKVEKRIQEVNDQIQNSYQSIIDIRIELTENRIEFLNRYINGNDAIQIQILPLCDRYHLEI